MDTVQQLQELVDYIEKHITEKLTVEKLSEEVGYSRFYLSKLFTVYTGMTPMAYTRRRKLNHAMTLLGTEQRIIDIAFELGYNSERAFIRAFGDAFGQPPGHFRGSPLSGTPKLTIYPLELPKKEGMEHMKEYLSDVRYETIDAMTVISGIAFGNEPEEVIIGEMTKFAHDYNMRIQRSFGFDFPVQSEMDVQQYRGYEYWILTDRLPSEEQLEKRNYALKNIPALKYVTIRITDPFSAAFERIPGGWKALVSWLETNNVKAFSGKDNYCLEEVKEIDGVTCMDIYIPVERA